MKMVPMTVRALIISSLFVPTFAPVLASADAMSDARSEVQLLQTLLALQTQIVAAINATLNQLQSMIGYNGNQYGNTAGSPSCSISLNPTSLPYAGAPVTLSWTSYNTVSANISSIGSVSPNGSRIIYPSGAVTYVMTVTGSNGQVSNCQTTVNASQNTTTTNGAFSVTPNYGYAPLAVAFTARLNTTSSCTGGSQFVDFGDGTNATVPYPAGVCSSTSYTLNHTYANNGTYTATLYAGQYSGTGIVGTAVVTVGTGASTSGPALSVYSTTTSSPNPTVSGKANSAAYPIYVSVNGVTYNAVISSDLTWSAIVTNALPRGTYIVTATTPNASAGNGPVNGTVTIL